MIPQCCSFFALKFESIKTYSTFLESASILETGGPGSMRVRAGTTVSLDCKAAGHPEPVVTWSKMSLGR